MNKEEQIKEMARVLCGNSYNAEKGFCNKFDAECDFMCNSFLKSKRISALGYGDTKQAVKEFAEKLKQKCIREEERFGRESDQIIDVVIPNLEFEHENEEVRKETAREIIELLMLNNAAIIDKNIEMYNNIVIKEISNQYCVEVEE